MEDKEAIAVLETLLKKYPLSGTEAEAIRDAIGVLGWTKLIEGWKEQKKRARERKISDSGAG
jgi:hypothetical protein